MSAPVDAVALSRLRWRCRRGMRELDEAMRAYLDHHYCTAAIDEQRRFEELLDWQDPELYQLVTGKQRNADYQGIIDKIGATLGATH